MRRKIHLQFCMVGIVSILATAILVLLVFYNLFQKQILEDLKLYAQVYQNSNFFAEENIEEWNENNRELGKIRITLMDRQGSVLFDSDANIKEMDNHSSRPEVAAALKNGDGKAIRRSSTLKNNTYYYAVCLNNGNVLRVSKNANSMMSILGSAFPILAMCIVLLLLFCFFLATFLTTRIIKPIEELGESIDQLEENNVYEELLPFARIIREQHENIVQQMKNLEQENKKIQMITDKMEEGLLLLDDKKNIIIANPSAVHLLTVIEGDYSGKNILHICRNELLSNCIETAKNGQKQYVDFVVGEKQLQAFANPVTDQDKIIGVMCFILDITENLRNEKLRRDFTANVSHELKTPLTSISGYAELIEAGMVDTKNLQVFAQKIRMSANRLLSLINDIIKLSELDDKEDTSCFTTLDLFEVVNNCVDSLALNAKKRNVVFTVEGQTEMISGDPSMIEELVYNLCDNAIRYNKPAGSVKVAVKKQLNYVELVVKDTGIGISKKHQKRVFERFYRVDKSRSKATGGTGLGLAIVKHIVEWHKASLTLESEEGQGTEIKIRFFISE